jgi:hypothetical protein
MVQLITNYLVLPVYPYLCRHRFFTTSIIHLIQIYCEHKKSTKNTYNSKECYKVDDFFLYGACLDANGKYLPQNTSVCL